MTIEVFFREKITSKKKACPKRKGPEICASKEWLSGRASAWEIWEGKKPGGRGKGKVQKKKKDEGTRKISGEIQQEGRESTNRNKIKEVRRGLGEG